MKKILFLVVVLALTFVGCQVDNVSEVGVGEATSTLTISLEGSRTALGNKGADGQYPLFWSEGDVIAANGVQSSPAVINDADAKVASFTLPESVVYPIKVTYPYYETTTAGAPKVYFQAEQNYVDGTFSQGAAPMCAYVANKSDEVELKHLAGLLRFPVKASQSGVVLSKVVITSNDGEKLAGEFSVNCQNATLTAAPTAQSSITYNANLELSTTSDKVLYIALPATYVGPCTVEFFDANGGKMRLGWNGNSVKAGVVREFKSITYAAGKVADLDGFEVEEDVLITEDMVCGYVRDTNGKPIEGVHTQKSPSISKTLTHLVRRAARSD